MRRENAAGKLSPEDWNSIAADIAWSKGGLLTPPPDELNDILTQDIQLIRPDEATIELLPTEQESYGQEFVEFQQTVE